MPIVLPWCTVLANSFVAPQACALDLSIVGSHEEATATIKVAIRAGKFTHWRPKMVSLAMTTKRNGV